ncbi:O-methyltransferase [Hyphobacterium marinum]|uniref:Class I SAM-dependent methyltransferase n=1 Tax=Hyphobacterium marinum TaxID=3116574 RepID=A0ABU7LVC8_9PROT|nr:class I SAM-dependent methyltransferase [Hyphobacterium sp. Y6023]MEE2565507.1 class I SAM-dependent methyltransferase [Hyphobacterium sp. Y6023]
MSRSIGLDETLTAYVRGANREEIPALKRCREETAKRDDARMQISPEQGAFMDLIARMTGAKTAVEIGVYTGYSALATARAMKDMHGENARLFACDVSADLIGIAETYWADGDVADVIQPVIGDARRTLAGLVEDGLAEQVDFMFVDADKTGYPDYYAAALTLLRPGGVILFDNVLWSGSVANPEKTDDDTEALRAITAKVRRDDRVHMAFTAIGDGLLMAMKK